MLRKLKNQKGFTLIEVLVVVIIVAILAALAVPIYMRYVEKSRSSEAQTAIAAIRKTYDVYRQTNGSTQDYTIERAMNETNLGEATIKNWKFEVTGNPPKKFIATSTEDFPGGPDKQVWYDVDDAKFHGYGVDQFTDPETEGVETDTETN
jgi:type IV pilus assembly protein PilE